MDEHPDLYAEYNPHVSYLHDTSAVSQILRAYALVVSSQKECCRWTGHYNACP